MKTIEQLQEILDRARVDDAPSITIIDLDTIETIVDDEPVVLHRSDRYGGHPLSGLATYGGTIGDHRMIEGIADDMQTAFKILNP